MSRPKASVPSRHCVTLPAKTTTKKPALMSPTGRAGGCEVTVPAAKRAPRAQASRPCVVGSASWGVRVSSRRQGSVGCGRVGPVDRIASLSSRPHLAAIAPGTSATRSCSSRPFSVGFTSTVRSSTELRSRETSHARPSRLSNGVSVPEFGQSRWPRSPTRCPSSAHNASMVVSAAIAHPTTITSWFADAASSGRAPR